MQELILLLVLLFLLLVCEALFIIAAIKLRHIGKRLDFISKLLQKGG